MVCGGVLRRVAAVGFASGSALMASIACGGSIATPTAVGTLSPSGTTEQSATIGPAGGTNIPAGGRISFYSPSSRTQIAEVDAVLEAVQAGDAAALLRLVQFTGVACVERPSGIGSPPRCPTGVASGSLVPVFAFDPCEAHFASHEEIQRWLRQALDLRPRLYAVYKPAAPTLGNADYIVLFGFREEQPAGTFRVFVRAGGAIPELGLCPPPGSMSLQNGGAMILPPK